MSNWEKTRQRLETRKAELTASAKEIDAELREPLDPDFGEQAVELEDDEVLEGRGRAALGEITQINTALQRLDNGIYETCASCGNSISQARLEAVPYATRCRDCLEG
ncbi:MAG: TraR/DksA family transcriptional regulator [Proteobacteria bacterium]|nr:TraR/DksA family transcriptional regulator [Pseudomonadota bacterium]MDA1024326.1 TraR/DksA family transcriptional regulator [Pseudomonadota bacterium]